MEKKIFLKKLVCVMSCRNRGSRLFGKPMQILNIKKNITIIEHLIDCLNKINLIISKKGFNKVAKN